LLFSADRFNDRAIFLGSFFLNTLSSKSSALLCSVTLRDHFFPGADFFVALFVVRFLVAAFFVAIGINFMLPTSPYLLASVAVYPEFIEGQHLSQFQIQLLMQL